MEQARSTEQSSEQLTSRVLDIHGIEDLRARQKDEYDSCYTPGEGVSDPEAMNSKMAELVKEYMRDNNVDETHPYWDSLYQNLRAWSYDNISNVTWDYGKWDNPSSSDRSIIPDTDGQSQVDNVRSMLVGNTGSNDMSSSSAPEPVASETSDSSGSENGSAEPDMEQMYDEAIEIDGKYNGLQEARKKFAATSGKRQGRIAGSGGKKNEKAHEDYQKKLRDFGVISVSGKIEDGDDDATKNVKVLEYLVEEQRKLREMTNEELNSGPVGKFLKWFNHENEEDSKSKKRLKKFGKSAVVAAAAAGAAGLITITSVGVGIGAGVGAATAGVIGGGRFIRGYGNADRHRGMAVTGHDGVSLEGTSNDTIDTRFDEASNEYYAIFEEDTKKEQKKRRKAAMWGAIAVGAGSAVGIAVEHISSIGDVDIRDATKDDITGNDGDMLDPKDTPPVKDIDNDGMPNWKDTDMDGDGVLNDQDTQPRNPDVTGVKEPELYESLSPEALRVERGEGWYQTFHEMGIPQNRWDEALELSGPKLQEEGWAYFDNANNEWRITKPGQLDESAINIIAGASKQAGLKLIA